MGEPIVSIIILNWNGLAVLGPCLQSLRENTAGPDYEVLLLDNGSTETGIEAMVAAHPRVRLVRSSVNHGFARGNNLAAREARGRYLVFLNNDTLPQPGWLEPLVSMAEKDPTCGLVGARLINSDGSIQHIGSYFAPEIRTYLSPYRGYPADAPGVDEPRECEAYIACCLLVRRDAFEAAGGFDERYRQGYEDFDLCLRVRERGYRLYYCPESRVIHFPETSTKKLDIRIRRRNKRENTAYFFEKWTEKLASLRLEPGRIPADMTGFNYYTKGRNDVVAFCPAGLDRVLEVGCGAGILGRDLKEQGKVRHVCGVELSAFAAAMARSRLDEVIAGDIEKLALSFQPASFDGVICADVLEHLRDPWRTLLNLVRSLKPNGVVVASIPNIRHYKVVRKLLQDKWMYEKEGTLDRTHLRFFSLSTIRDLMNFSGLEVTVIARKKRARPWLLTANRAWPGLDELLTYQYLIQARKRPAQARGALGQGRPAEVGG